MDDPGVCPVCGAKGFSCMGDVLESAEGGVRIIRMRPPGATEGPIMHKLASDTYVNRDSTKVVPEGHVDSAFLLGMAGDEISDETATRLGLAPAGLAEVGPRGGGAAAVAKEYTKAELLEHAKARGLEIPSKATKAEIVVALAEDQAAKDAAAAAEAASAGTADQGDAEETAQGESPAEA